MKKKESAGILKTGLPVHQRRGFPALQKLRNPLYPSLQYYISYNIEIITF